MDLPSSSDIDAAILAVAQTSWDKVAMIIAQAAKKLHGDLPNGDEPYEIIGRRIEVLVRDGRLIAQGDISRWRQSEIRLPRK